jgi:hypothetical protein
MEGRRGREFRSVEDFGSIEMSNRKERRVDGREYDREDQVDGADGRRRRRGKMSAFLVCNATSHA